MKSQIVTFSVCLYVAAVSGINDTLRLVNLVYRHGDRSPTERFPTDPTPITTWPDGLGWLTKKGEKQHYSLGRYFRRRYGSLLSNKYDNSEITVNSSGVDRCLMSAYSNLAGLYAPTTEQLWNKDILWQPIPVHTRPTDEDNMLAILKPCNMYDEVYYGSLKSERVIRFQEENKEFFDYLSEKSGLTITIDNLWIISDEMFCEKQHNISLPPWVNDTVYEKLRELEVWGWDLLYREKVESRLKGGPLLKEWIRLCQKKVEDEEYLTKMNMFSAHDSTVVALLSTMGLYNGQIPPYTTTVIMELHQHSLGDYYVELYLRNVTSEDPDDDTQPHPLTLPGCQFQCPYHQFVSLTSDDVPVDWEAECSLETGTISEDPYFRRAFIIAVSVCSVVTLCLFLVVMVTAFRRNRRGGAGMI